MFLVTNRRILGQSGGCSDVLGSVPNELGPNELRIVEAVKRRGKWHLEVLPDDATQAMRDEARIEDSHITSYITAKLLDRINPQARDKRSKRKGMNLLVFVHGFNNDVEDVLERSRTLSRNYNLEVLPFSWPANGGGVTGTASYKSDKRDARASVGALDRILYSIDAGLKSITGKAAKEVQAEAARKFPGSAEKRSLFITRALEKSCPFTVNLMAHSMGNYLYKHLLQSTASEGKGMAFDNVVLVAADTNNKDHARWVDQIRARRRVYITINEDDQALQVSRLKTGDEQLARLGHYPFDLDSKYAAYIQFTDARNVGNSHAYFEGDPLQNAKVKQFFRDVLNGRRADNKLDYDSASNTYLIR